MGGLLETEGVLEWEREGKEQLSPPPPHPKILWLDAPQSHNQSCVSPPGGRGGSEGGGQILGSAPLTNSTAAKGQN